MAAPARTNASPPARTTMATRVNVLQAGKVRLAIRLGVHPDDISDRRAFESLTQIEQVIVAGESLQRHAEASVEEVLWHQP